MRYEKHIEIYVIKDNINIPLASNPTLMSNCSIGDYVVIFDNFVWVRDWNDEREEQYSESVFHPEFVRANTTIFDRVG